MKKVCFVLGTRPEIIKLAPLLRRVVTEKIPFMLIHTNQHYDFTMDTIFFEQLSLPEPHRTLHAAAPSADDFKKNVMSGLEKIWVQEKPSVVIAQGDTNTVAAAALAAEKATIPFAHVEAGLRSDDLTMPEEHNRILADRIGARLYVPSTHQVKRLQQEKIAEDRIMLTGNTISDAVNEHLPLAMGTPLPKDLSTLPKEYAPITLHRPALVDHPELFRSVLTQIADALMTAKIQGVLLAHPRAKKTLDGLGFASPAILVYEPIGYLSMLRLLQSAAIVLTDSGGLQEETALLKIRCVTLRDNTERPETIDAGGNVLVSPTRTMIAATIASQLRKNIDWKPLYAHDSPSDTILSDLLQYV